MFDPHHALHFSHGFSYVTAIRLYRLFHFRLVLSFCVPTVLFISSTGISTCYPSTTTFVLALGPDLPREDQLYPETLDIRPLRFSLKSRYSFRHSLFLTLHCSLQYSFVDLRMLLYHPFGSTASVSCFSPGHFRRRTSRLVSYYALFECMAASEPTS